MTTAGLTKVTAMSRRKEITDMLKKGIEEVDTIVGVSNIVDSSAGVGELGTRRRLRFYRLLHTDATATSIDVELNYWVALIPSNTNGVKNVKEQLNTFTTDPPTSILNDFKTLSAATSVEATFFDPTTLKAGDCLKKFRFDERTEECVSCEILNCDRCDEDTTKCQVCTGDDIEQKHWALSSTNDCVSQCESGYQKTFHKFTFGEGEDSEEESGFKCEPFVDVAAIVVIVVLVVFFIGFCAAYGISKSFRECLSRSCGGCDDCVARYIETMHEKAKTRKELRKTKADAKKEEIEKKKELKIAEADAKKEEIENMKQLKSAETDAKKEEIENMKQLKSAETDAKKEEIKNKKQANNSLEQILTETEEVEFKARLEKLLETNENNNSSSSRLVMNQNDLVFGESLDSMDLQKFLGMSDEYANKVEENGEKMIEEEIKTTILTQNL